jgi:hypothetical protein
MRLLALCLIALLAPGAPDAPRPSHRALPWLYNLHEVAAVEADDRGSTFQLDDREELDPTCGSGAVTGLELRADVAPAPGTETVLASYARGTVVVGSEGQVLATTPGYPCAGTSDALEVLAVGRAFGQPTIVIAATTGGRREQLTWLGLFRVGSSGRLEATFSGEVEERADGEVRRGSITILPGALLHRSPDGELVFWIFDEPAGIYVPSALLGPGEPAV